MRSRNGRTGRSIAINDVIETDHSSAFRIRHLVSNGIGDDVEVRIDIEAVLRAPKAR